MIPGPIKRRASPGRGEITEDTASLQAAMSNVWFWQESCANAVLMLFEVSIEKLKVRPPAGAGSPMFQPGGSIVTSLAGRGTSLVYKSLDKALALLGGLFSLQAG